jgi:NTP pyrophosphatase (non-canonical NTP hydrolase)
MTTTSTEPVITQPAPRPGSWSLGLDALIEICGSSAKANGWHDGRRRAMEADDHFGGSEFMTAFVTSKLALFDTETSEAIEEVRAGNAPTRTYYKTPQGEIDQNEDGSVTDLHGDGKALLKPEGVPSELADVLIRVLDFAFMERIDLCAIVEEKLRFNAQRGHRHGGKAI